MYRVAREVTSGLLLSSAPGYVRCLELLFTSSLVNRGAREVTSRVVTHISAGVCEMSRTIVHVTPCVFTTDKAVEYISLFSTSAWCHNHGNFRNLHDKGKTDVIFTIVCLSLATAINTKNRYSDFMNGKQ